MQTSLKIVGIVASLRKKSYNRATLRAAQQLPPESAVIETFELDGIPPVNEDDLLTNPPAIVNMYPLNLPEVIIRNSAHRFDEQGDLVNEATRDIMRKFLQALVLWTRQVEHGKQIQA
jgi:hypothetical protein